MDSKKVPLEISSEVVVKGKVVAKRMTDSIDADIIKAVASKVEAAYDGDIMFSNDQK